MVAEDEVEAPVVAHFVWLAVLCCAVLLSFGVEGWDGWGYLLPDACYGFLTWLLDLGRRW